MFRIIKLFLLMAVSPVFLSAQSSPFQIVFEPAVIEGLPGLQSFAYGQYDGKWLIIGGRTDGLHRRQPFAAFNAQGKNNELIVVDPIAKRTWKAPLNVLTPALQDQLSATNMEFHQDGETLYIIGGYGYSDVEGKHTTYDKLTAVDVSKIINAIINGTAYNSYFRQISNPAFAVTGGHLKKIDDQYCLIGGQKFIGRYNPMGPDHGPGFFQDYSNQIRKFSIINNVEDLQIANYQTITDTAAFHRRDYNVVPQIFPDGSAGLTAFSGVFQTDVQYPYVNAVDIKSDEYKANPSFSQYYNHYHCAVLPVYSEAKNEMSSVFFGGIAQYYDSAGILVQNDEVPFTKTIARVTRDKDGKMAEYKLPVEMPGLSGAGAEFIAVSEILQYDNKVIKLDALTADTTLVGYILGGISSTLPNVFLINTGNESKAINTLQKVYVIKNAAGRDQLNVQSNNGLQLQIIPKYADGIFILNFKLNRETTVNIQISVDEGKVIKKDILKNLPAGEHHISQKIKRVKPGKSYWISLQTASINVKQKITIEP